MARFTILSTRPLSPDILQDLSDKDIEVVTESFIQVQTIQSASLQEKMQAYAQQSITAIFTSQNAWLGVAENLPPNTPALSGWTIFCLSGATLQAIMNSQLVEPLQVAGIAPEAALLAPQITHYSPAGELVFFCGNQRRNVIPDALHAAAIPCTEIKVYKTVATPVTINKIVDAVLFFSPSAVKSFFGTNQLPPHIPCFAIGQTTAGAIRTMVPNPVMASPQPDPVTLLNNAIEYLQSKDQHQ
ncbi:MAG: uroporphyrinogen-III synthase [Candidatus Pseudobacter hemicellulosilyticus]|uniref:Uroporphyrinogen-III synthase n=1 Tax=Candidatus Pseudobacter hemicellulosilyticus TaxID=3121375 RepID=A0AAJ5WTX5_9BACT|nr:MAG: uroporphyrinogen-III synthase [Pseudobacter sp.]